MKFAYGYTKTNILILRMFVREQEDNTRKTVTNLLIVHLACSHVHGPCAKVQRSPAGGSLRLEMTKNPFLFLKGYSMIISFIDLS